MNMKNFGLVLLVFFPLLSIGQTSQYCYYKDTDGQVQLYNSITDRDLDGFTKKFTADKEGVKSQLSREQFQSVSFISKATLSKTESFSYYAQEVKTLNGKGKSEKIGDVKMSPILCSWKGQVNAGKMLISTTTWQVIFSDSSGNNVILKKYIGIVSRTAGGQLNSDKIDTYIEEKGEIQYAFISNNKMTYFLAGDKDKRMAVLDLCLDKFSAYPEAKVILEKMKSIQAKSIGERSTIQVSYIAELSKLYFEKYFVQL
jgi:hypothetical protein